jgi:TRAP-type mannitol/chloroaromatic compound transport system permease large subunit
MAIEVRLPTSWREGAMSELSLLFTGVWARSLRRNSKKAGAMTVAALNRYQTWILLIMAINATTMIGSVLNHDFPGKTIFGLVWLAAFGAALITVILSSELGGTTSRPALVDRGRSLRSATRFG